MIPFGAETVYVHTTLRTCFVYVSTIIPLLNPYTSKDPAAVSESNRIGVFPSPSASYSRYRDPCFPPLEIRSQSAYANHRQMAL
jgi:hypothetical protein